MADEIKTKKPASALTTAVGYAQCYDCSAAVGELHDEGCDVERCPDCGGQMLSCDCAVESVHPRIPWNGEWPGVAECREYGFWCYWGPPWISCNKDHPEAREDLNRLYKECEWNATTQRLELPSHT